MAWTDIGCLVDADQEEPFDCDKCQYTFWREQDLDDHIEIHHPEFQRGLNPSDNVNTSSNHELGFRQKQTNVPAQTEERDHQDGGIANLRGPGQDNSHSESVQAGYIHGESAAPEDDSHTHQGNEDLRVVKREAVIGRKCEYCSLVLTNANQKKLHEAKRETSNFIRAVMWSDSDCT